MSETLKKASGRDAFGQALVELAAEIPTLVVLDADVSSSTKTAAFGQAHPGRFFNVGVAEGNMVDVAGGLATCGLRPVASTFALFLALKASEQIRNVICYNRLPVVLAGGYAGLSDSYDGASHQAITDISVMRAMPEMTVVVPSDASEVKPLLAQALRRDGPTYLRLGRNPTPVLFEGQPPQEGAIRKVREGRDVTVAATGAAVPMAVRAAIRLAEMGIDAEILAVHSIKPIDEDSLVASARKTHRVVTLEEHTILGGLGGAVAEVLARRAPTPMEILGVGNTFTESGDYDALLDKYGISVSAIVAAAARLVAS